MSMGLHARVAVIGASGIGKHHAKWWHLEGADAVAFLGTSEDSVAATADALRGLFGFTGRGYTDLHDMLEAERPEIVDVCSPPSCHFDHARAAIEAGCHVLCEKPFVFDSALPRETLIEQGQELIDRADRKGVRLGVCTQYVVSARTIRRIRNESHGPIRASRYKVHLASPSKGRAPDPERVWIDLGPHPLSGLQELSQDGEILWDTVQTNFDEYEARATFTARRISGESLDCEIVTGNTTGKPSHIREVTLDDSLFVIGGENDADGVYCACIDTDDGHYVEPDFMRTLIRDFLAGTPATDGPAGLTNLDWLLRILEIARDAG